MTGFESGIQRSGDIFARSGASRHHRVPCLAMGAAAALLVCWQLLVPPVVGMANNGDFSKLLSPFSLRNPDYREYISLRILHGADYQEEPGFHSSEALLLEAALAANRVLSKDGSGTLDLRLVGIIHAVVYLAALVLFATLFDRRRRVLQAVLCAAALLIFGDVMYVSYLNSFYMDTAALLALLLVAVFYLRAIAGGSRLDAWLFLASCLLFVASKPQHALPGVCLAALMWFARKPLWGGRNLVAGASAGLLLLSALAMLAWGAPAGYSAKNCFNIVFFQILPESRDVNRAMADLGLGETYRVWIGRTAYGPGAGMEDSAFSAAFARRVSYLRIGEFYVTHPRDAWRAWRNALDQAGREREEIGNFPQSAGLPPSAESHAFALWSDGKRALFEHHGVRLLWCFLVLSAAVAALCSRLRARLAPGAMAGIAALLATTWFELLIASFGDALDLPRHHLIYFAEFDMLVLAALFLACRWGSERLQKRP